jgi:hypothetical protein
MSGHLTRFTFKCYQQHWMVPMIQSLKATATFIFSKEGVTQGTLSAVAYTIALRVLPLFVG